MTSQDEKNARTWLATAEERAGEEGDPMIAALIALGYAILSGNPELTKRAMKAGEDPVETAKRLRYEAQAQPGIAGTP